MAHSSAKTIVCQKVYYETNEDLGLDPFCYECISHKSRARKGYIHCQRNGFQFMHKWVYWNATGETPEVVKHLCYNPGCLNLAHLKGMTAEEAMEIDKVPVRRCHPPAIWGLATRKRIIDPKQVRLIRQALEDGYTPTQIGYSLGINSTIVQAILNKQAYSRVP